MPSADTTTTTTLATDLRRLGFNRTADDLNDLIAQAARKRSSATVLLEHIVAAELEDKQRRSVESRLTRARLGRFKPLADWDWQWPTALDRPALERILTLDFLARGENVILIGAQGLGKTMLAKNIAHQAILAGHTALFTTAADLLLNLNGQETARALERRLRHYTRPALLVVDEVGYLAYDARAADLLFQLVSRRYEHRSLLITTNLPFKRWDTVFPNASCAVALIDRLTHHVEILLLEGRSYRRREAEISQQERNPNDRTVTTRRNHRDPHVVNETGRYLCRNDQFLALGNTEQFYAGRLGPRPELARQQVIGPGPLSGSGLRFVAVEHAGNTNASTEEAARVAALLRELLDGGAAWVDKDGARRPLTLNDILVVAPYNAQVATLRSALPDGARAGTVDKFQGQEAPVVIYSMATSTPDEARRGMEFLYSLNRLNVATSRARCVAAIVASPALLAPDCRTPEQMRLANPFCRFLELAEAISVPGAHPLAGPAARDR